MGKRLWPGVDAGMRPASPTCLGSARGGEAEMPVVWFHGWSTVDRHCGPVTGRETGGARKGGARATDLRTRMAGPLSQGGDQHEGRRDARPILQHVRTAEHSERRARDGQVDISWNEGGERERGLPIWDVRKPRSGAHAWRRTCRSEWRTPGGKHRWPGEDRAERTRATPRRTGDDDDSLGPGRSGIDGEAPNGARWQRWRRE